MGKIKNTESLLNHGDRESRKKITELLERMWAKVDAYHLIKELMSVDGNCLTIGTRRWDMDKLGNIYLFGAGKACNAMAMAVCDVLKEKLTEGVISVKIAEDNDTYINTRVYVGGHPLPNEEGYRAAEDIIQMIDKGKPGDLFISVISGGSSALLTCPKEGITLQEEIQAQDMLLRSGAKIEEINAVRRHISRTNGGRLTEQVLKNGAEIVNIIVGDGVGVKPTVDFKAPFQFFGTPVAPDKTTIQDARDCIRNYQLEDKLPESILKYLYEDNPEHETPKAFGEGVTHFCLNNVPDSCEAAVEAAREMGISSMVFSTFIEGESREAGYFFASMAREIQANHRPIKAPCFVFCSGETTTKVEDGCRGTGGPSHELALGFAHGARYTAGAALASVDTEGTDGTTRYAGALTDSQTSRMLSEKGINIFDVFRTHDYGGALECTQDSILTGNTGTNLCDFNVMYVPEAE